MLKGPCLSVFTMLFIERAVMCEESQLRLLRCFPESSLLRRNNLLSPLSSALSQLDVSTGLTHPQSVCADHVHAEALSAVPAPHSPWTACSPPTPSCWLVLKSVPLFGKFGIHTSLL